MDAKDISDLALRVAAMSNHDRDEFDKEVSGLRAELRLREENRIAELRAMPDLEVIDRIISVACPDGEATLQELRDAGFVRNPPTYPKQSFVIGVAPKFEVMGTRENISALCEHLKIAYPNVRWSKGV